jgi:nitroimidazol reductase NimA-like FMN-containing flavoprotein (pyridoxamine 5'-phosphate oxidase superfamily)
MLKLMTAMVVENDICVLATASGNRPYCSLMAYCAGADGTRVYMTTLKNSKKFENLTANPAVSLLIDTRCEKDRAETRALTVTGTCREVIQPDERRAATRRLLSTHPHIASFLDDPDAVVLCVQAESFLLLDGVSEAHFVAVDPSSD